MATSAELKELLTELRSNLEQPLVEAEKKVIEEKEWLQLLYKGLTGSDSSSPEQTDLTISHTIGFLSDMLPALAQTITTD